MKRSWVSYACIVCVLFLVIRVEVEFDFAKPSFNLPADISEVLAVMVGIGLAEWIEP